MHGLVVVARTLRRQGFPDADLDVVTLRVNDPWLAVAAVRAGDTDASFRSVTDRSTLPPDVRMIRAFESPLELLVGPSHPLAATRTLTRPQLRRYRIWVPGIAPGSELAQFYDELADAFDLTIDAAGQAIGWVNRHRRNSTVEPKGRVCPSHRPNSSPRCRRC